MGRTTVRNIKAFKLAVGDAAARNVLIATTMWKGIDETTGNQRMKDLTTNTAYFQPFIEAGASIRAYKEGDDALDIINTVIQNRKPVPIEMQKEGKTFMYRIVKWLNKSRG